MAKGFRKAPKKSKPRGKNQYDNNFLQDILRIAYNTDGNPQFIYPFLEANLNKLYSQKFLIEWQIVCQYIIESLNYEQMGKFYHQIKINQQQDIDLEQSLSNALYVAIGMLYFIEKLIYFPNGNKGINIEISIYAYETLAKVFTIAHDPEQGAVIQNVLAIAYRNRIHGNHQSNIEKAIQCYEEVLQVINKENNINIWITTLINISVAYAKRLAGNRADNLEQAIGFSEQILQVCNPDNFIEDWIFTKRGLGSFYRDKVYGNKADNLEVAISHYQDILPFLNNDLYTEDWLTIQSGLGLCYCNRIKGDTPENTEKAINYFQAALEVCQHENFAVNRINILNNLGNAYRQRQLGNKSENLESGIKCLQDALQVATFDGMPEEWAMSNINLASLYNDRIIGDKVENSNIAIKYFQAAAKVYNPRDYPQNWATLQNNLGLLYGRLGIFEQQIKCLQASLEVCNREKYPPDWAQTQYNLGLGYCEIGLIDEAILSFRRSLEIFQPSIFPLDCLLSGRYLGNTAFSVKRWTEAIQGYSLAIDAVEQSRSWVNSESRRQEILEESIDVYQKMVQACINAGEIDKAFEYAERSRSQRLVDLMAGFQLSQGEDIPPKVQELLQQYEELQRQIDQERQSNQSENSRSETRAAWSAYNEAIAFLETAKQQVWENLRREDPVLAGEIQVNPLSLSEIQQLIEQPNTAILSFYTTNDDTHIFVVRKDQINLHTCTGQGLETLQGWISQNWLLPYKDDLKKWETQIESILHQLAERLQISELISQYLQGIEELILVPHLLLHQIPFAALPTGEYQEYLGDKFLIRYTPSCQILEFCHQRQNVETLHATSLQYGIVEDAEDNLPCARFEGETLAQMYNIPPENRLIGSSQATRENYRQLAQKVQIIHSCHHAQSRLDNPLESQLKLAPGESITLGDLMTPSWRLPKLVEVFLSCCETNLGIPSLTDDILTLSTGFLCAGARSVISSLWSVNDLATALFSIFYYRQRKLGKSRPEALRQGQIQLRELRKADLKEISQQVEEREKELIGNRKKYTLDSIERGEWEREYNLYAKFNRRIKEIENSNQQFPFANPRYWAAFICHGLQ